MLQVRHIEQGAALIELAVVLPFLLMVSLLGIEYSNAIRTSELSIQLSREAASMVHRNCKKQIEEFDPSMPEMLQVCLDQVSVSLQASIRPLAEELAILVKVYRWAPGVELLASGKSACPVVRTDGTVFDCSSYTSSFDPAALGSRFDDALSAAGNLAVAEVYFNRPSLFGEVSRHFGHRGGALHSVGVF